MMMVVGILVVVLLDLLDERLQSGAGSAIEHLHRHVVHSERGQMPITSIQIVTNCKTHTQNTNSPCTHSTLEN